jgi:hypothetical protein
MRRYRFLARRPYPLPVLRLLVPLIPFFSVSGGERAGLAIWSRFAGSLVRRAVGLGVMQANRLYHEPHLQLHNQQRNQKPRTASGSTVHNEVREQNA